MGFTECLQLFCLIITCLNFGEAYNAAMHKYISQLQFFWSAYYEIQKIALYDFLKMEDLHVVFDTLINRQL